MVINIYHHGKEHTFIRQRLISDQINLYRKYTHNNLRGMLSIIHYHG